MTDEGGRDDGREVTEGVLKDQRKGLDREMQRMHEVMEAGARYQRLKQGTRPVHRPPLTMRNTMRSSPPACEMDVILIDGWQGGALLRMFKRFPRDECSIPVL